jgi:hypothetical protein
MVHVSVTQDGTYTVYRDRLVLACGLTHRQADEFAHAIDPEHF